MKSGRSQKMTDDELLNAVEEHPDRCVTAVELAEELDMTSTGILKRLESLKEAGEVRKKKVGSRAVVWWVQD